MLVVPQQARLWKPQASSRQCELTESYAVCTIVRILTGLSLIEVSLCSSLPAASRGEIRNQILILAKVILIVHILAVEGSLLTGQLGILAAVCLELLRPRHRDRVSSKKGGLAAVSRSTESKVKGESL